MASPKVRPWREPGYHFLGRPWFVHEAIIKLEELIEPGWRAFEWGSGSSTLWLAVDLKADSVVSLEHDREWYEQTQAELERYFVDNVELVHAGLGGPYAGYINNYPAAHFDLILVDGRERAACLANAIARLKPGGIMVLDNSEREQYQWAVKLLAGWQRWEFASRGGGYAGWTTTIWRKPDENLPPPG